MPTRGPATRSRIDEDTPPPTDTHSHPSQSEQASATKSKSGRAGSGSTSGKGKSPLKPKATPPKSKATPPKPKASPPKSKSTPPKSKGSPSKANPKFVQRIPDTDDDEPETPLSQSSSKTTSASAKRGAKLTATPKKALKRGASPSYDDEAPSRQLEKGKSIKKEAGSSITPPKKRSKKSSPPVEELLEEDVDEAMDREFLFSPFSSDSTNSGDSIFDWLVPDDVTDDASDSDRTHDDDGNAVQDAADDASEGEGANEEEESDGEDSNRDPADVANARDEEEPFVTYPEDDNLPPLDTREGDLLMVTKRSTVSDVSYKEVASAINNLHDRQTLQTAVLFTFRPSFKYISPTRSPLTATVTKKKEFAKNLQFTVPGSSFLVPTLFVITGYVTESACTTPKVTYEATGKSQRFIAVRPFDVEIQRMANYICSVFGLPYLCIPAWDGSIKFLGRPPATPASGRATKWSQETTFPQLLGPDVPIPILDARKIEGIWDLQTRTINELPPFVDGTEVAKGSIVQVIFSARTFDAPEASPPMDQGHPGVTFDAQKVIVLAKTDPSIFPFPTK